VTAQLRALSCLHSDDKYCTYLNDFGFEESAAEILLDIEVITKVTKQEYNDVETLMTGVW
jgi:hypothetical protein